MSLLESVFNHLVLPPRLPGTRDENIEEIEANILNRLIRACSKISSSTGPEYTETWTRLRHSLRSCYVVNLSKLSNNSLLQDKFRTLIPGDVLILHIVEQNAALLIRRDSRDETGTVIFEAFEASPSSESVLASQGALLWDFPGRAVEISLDEFSRTSFQESLANFVDKACSESLSTLEARSSKAKTSVIEARDSSDPALITQMLMSLLEAIGSSADVPRLRKRVRDDVNIQKAEIPWRRLPFWLVLRVAMQRQLTLSLGNDKGQACYKFLICAVLVQFLEDAAGTLAPELSMLIRAKICRRLAKLEMDKSHSVSASTYQQLFDSVGPWFKATIELTTKLAETAWTNFKMKTTRLISKLPPRADEAALRLSLPNSGRYLDSVLSLPRNMYTRQPSSNIPPNNFGVENISNFIGRYFLIAKREQAIATQSNRIPSDVKECELLCIKMAGFMSDLFTLVGDAYDSNPEQMSIFLLNIFDMWVLMDMYAVKACPLLQNYHPVFTPDILDVLQLLHISDMKRLQNIQIYLRDRCERSIFAHRTIFSDPDQNCFAAQHVGQSTRLQTLQLQIETASLNARKRKQSEWKRACDQYDILSQKISEGSCLCHYNIDGSRNVKGCTKCWHKRSRNRMKISVHEDFLPENKAQKAAIIFELGLPSFFSAYRNATWRIIRDLAHPSKPEVSQSPAMILSDYTQLKGFAHQPLSDLSFASKKKSFLQTHYKELRMKVDWPDVSFPLGLEFSYFDKKSGFWLKDLAKPLTFQHLCGVQIPRCLQTSVLKPLEHPVPNFDGPSSYEIAANQTKCPQNTSIHEFTAYQRLLSGKLRRWPVMLVELGSSNLNFSAEDTMLLFTQLAIQAGPSDARDNPIRDIHSIFLDSLFSERLIEQVKSRLNTIVSNWRETHCMEMLITLMLRLLTIPADTNREGVLDLLVSARDATLQWTFRLRDEVRNASDASEAETAAEYGFFAALLCRRTFDMYVESESHMGAKELSSFIQASVALQSNLVVDPTKLSQNLRNMLIRDTKMAFQIQPVIRKAIETHNISLSTAVSAALSDPKNVSERIFSPWRFFQAPHERWLVSTMSRTTHETSGPQVVHYNYLEGHLLIDGKPLGKLPQAIRESENAKRLFGNQHLLAYPSPMQGMSHVMATSYYDHEIHFGFRGSEVIVRAYHRGELLEFVPGKVFIRGNDFDLPCGLIDGCAHWLNLTKRRLEIRREPKIWATKIKDWILDVRNRQAHRGWRPGVILVDPYSDLSRRVAGIFKHFEDAERLTIFQPKSARSTLSVEIRRLELSFFVNRKNLLQCNELHAEIDPNQDAGTLYGFESKIVLRHILNPNQRSIITPVGSGKMKFTRYGMHIAFQTEIIGEYVRFKIDTVLGQLTCPHEPRLIYSKALFHAMTSFVLPDPLTGRTGTEEALHTLQSGYSQPWKFIGFPTAILEAIKSLSPAREYYPPDRRSLQTVNWSPHLTATIQHDSYEALVKDIITQSNQLNAFDQVSDDSNSSKSEKISHLRHRGEYNRLLYERISPWSDETRETKDRIYDSRDSQIESRHSKNVYQISKLIHTQPFKINISKGLSQVLQAWKLIGGFHETGEYMPSNLSNSIEETLSEQWGNLVNFCRKSAESDIYKVTFRLCLLAFNQTPNIDAIKILVAYSCLDELKALETPMCTSFSEFKLHEQPTIDSLEKIIAADYPPFVPATTQNNGQRKLAQKKHFDLCATEARKFARTIIKQWPEIHPSINDFQAEYINTCLSLAKIEPELKRLHNNELLSIYIDEIQKALNNHTEALNIGGPLPRAKSMTDSFATRRGSIIPSFSNDLIIKVGPSSQDRFESQKTDNLNSAFSMRIASHTRPDDMFRLMSLPSKEIFELGGILGTFSKSENGLRHLYGKDLEKSLSAFKRTKSAGENRESSVNIDTINEKIEKIRILLKEQLGYLRDALSANDDRAIWLQLGNLWPCITPITTLEQLRSSSGYQFGTNMKESFIAYGLSLTALQRLLRIKDAQLRNDLRKVGEELQNRGHENWNPLDYPDWLLLELDSDILIRPQQIDVAHAIISPISKSNLVLQMNMGQGKTSCIMPMAAALLANKKQLTRLIVPKALLLPTAQTLQAKLGGLVGQKVKHIPFSRRTSTSPSMLELYSDLHRQTLHDAGIILTTPENILSYNLSGLQRLADSKLDEARHMIEFQSWLTDNCRDILDECDFTLAAKTQLIYPSGTQLSVDGHPHRWQIAQILLSLVEDHLPDLQEKFPKSIEVIQRSQGFPMVNFLQSDVEEDLMRRLTADVCDGKTSFLRFAEPTLPTARADLEGALMERAFTYKQIKHVSKMFEDKSDASQSILIVRGLLLNKILLLCMKKRWNVRYGLHPGRDPIAVPYEAKGVPSEQAEFGHPDVAIVLTCLAFYYSGLSISQFSDDLQRVLRSDDPATEYDKWISGSQGLPEVLHHWNVINVGDKGQVEELWHHLRLNRNVVNHYMNHFVFPDHAKQFGTKLQASGWDLPLFTKSQGTASTVTRARTTGFSGTNDNKMLLPLTIKQNELPGLSQTNAEVLTYLLQERNRRYVVAAQNNKCLTEEELLMRLKDMKIKILIDAGAFVLEMDNRTLVKNWLEVDTKPKAGVFFKADNRAWVLYRGSKKEVPLLATPFAENLSQCVVYLDEAHTRGVDMKLPRLARGALTLALDQTKDHTVQAAMRLRQLASTQSVVFFAPPAVHKSILDVCKPEQNEILNSTHVVKWLLEQTCRANEQIHSLYLAQGTDFCRRINAQWENADFLTKKQHRAALLETIQHPDHQTLQQLYCGDEELETKPLPEISFPVLKEFTDELRNQRKFGSDKGFAVNSSALEEVEQEREVEFQVEEVRQVQKPKHFKALGFPGLHQAISSFVKKGKLDIKHADGYENMFSALSQTEVGKKFSACTVDSKLFVSAQFMRTINMTKGGSNDNFIRPVEWLLWSPSTETGLVIIPEEFELLVPLLQSERKKKVHLISYAAPVTKSMQHFNHLSYYVLPSLPAGYTLPEWLPLQLGVLAGRLYFNFKELVTLKNFLQISGQSGNDSICFAKNPTKFLQEWLSVRRKGQEIMHTPMGYICQGRPLHEKHPFFAAPETDADRAVAPSVWNRRASSELDDLDDGESDLEYAWDVEDEIEGDVD